MKYSALIVALVFAPTSIHAQNPQYSDCRTLQASGNFVGSDEAIVNGLVCKVGKPKTDASGKSWSEGSLALLGILTPETLRSKETGTKAPVSEPTPGATPGPAQSKSNPGAPTPVRAETAVKQETSLPVIGAESASAPDVQAQVRTAMPASAQRTPTNALIAASPDPSAAAATHESKPELLSTVGSLAVATASNASPEFEANNSEEDAAFREGQGPACRKNVSLGSMEKDKLFLAIPVWALQWLEKNQKRFPGICFSDSLMSGAKNYLVVFYMAAPPAAGASALKNVSVPVEMTPGSRMGSFTTSFGSTWHYTYERTVTTTITSASAEKAPHNQASGPLYVTAYSEQGIPISHHSPTGVIKQVEETSHKQGKRNDAELGQFRLLEEALEKMVKDIAKL